MSKAKVIKHAVAEAAAANGFLGAKGAYRKRTDEVIWIVQLVKERGTGWGLGCGVWGLILPPPPQSEYPGLPQPTPAEKSLWREIRANQLGVKFRRQAAVGEYVVDFICFPKNLVVELDGPKHLEPDAVEKDARRTEWLESQGFRVMRFRNQELDENLQQVVNAIRRAVE